MKHKSSHSFFRDLIVYYTATLRTVFQLRSFRVIGDLRYFPKWRKFRISDEGTLEHETPWLVFTSIDFLNSFLTDSMRVFEFGSGGSTEFFRKRVLHVTSIEHDRNWYEKVNAHFINKRINNVELKLIQPVSDPGFSMKDVCSPENCLSSRQEYRGFSFEEYVKSVLKYPDNFFDLIVVDGRARTSCIHYSFDKIKTGGLLLVDNADRTAYLKPFPELMNPDKWIVRRFTGHFPFSSASILSKTLIFQKK